MRETHMFRAVTRVLPDSWRKRLRTSLAAVPSITAGPARGLKFDSGDSNPAYASGGNELPVQEAIAASLGPGGVFFDIGANVGFFTVVAAHLVGPLGRVVAFEPVLTNVEHIRANVARNGMTQVTIVPKAVADRSGSATLLLAEYCGGAALATVAAAPPDQIGEAVVPVVAVDDLVQGGALPPPDVVKIDVEGAELSVLQGMAETLRTATPHVIFEIDDTTAEGFAAKQSSCSSFLSALGYSVTRLPDSYSNTRWLVGHFLARVDSDASRTAAR